MTEGPQVPKFRSIEQEIAFWESHSSLEFTGINVDPETLEPLLPRLIFTRDGSHAMHLRVNEGRVWVTGTESWTQRSQTFVGDMGRPISYYPKDLVGAKGI